MPLALNFEASHALGVEGANVHIYKKKRVAVGPAQHSSA